MRIRIQVNRILSYQSFSHASFALESNMVDIPNRRILALGSAKTLNDVEHISLDLCPDALTCALIQCDVLAVRSVLSKENKLFAATVSQTFWPDRHFVQGRVRGCCMFALPSSAGGGAIVTGAGGRCLRAECGLFAL